MISGKNSERYFVRPVSLLKSRQNFLSAFAVSGKPSFVKKSNRTRLESQHFSLSSSNLTLSFTIFCRKSRCKLQKLSYFFFEVTSWGHCTPSVDNIALLVEQELGKVPFDIVRQGSRSSVLSFEPLENRMCVSSVHVAL